MNSEKLVEGADIVMVDAYLLLGFKDYVAARHLLIDGFLLQGAILASTAVEKYLKACLCAMGRKPQGHLDGPKLRREIQANLSHLHNKLNIDFIEFLGRVYKLRYSDGLGSPISAGVEQYKVLAA